MEDFRISESVLSPWKPATMVRIRNEESTTNWAATREVEPLRLKKSKRAHETTPQQLGMLARVWNR